MAWPDYLENPLAISSLFANPDDLSQINLHEIMAHRDGPVVRLRFDVTAMPEIFPARWPAEANTTQVTLAAWDVTTLQLDGWATSVFGQLSVARDGNRYLLSFASKTCQLRASCSSLRLERLQGYVNHPDG
jgi:hypothetical protein